MLLKRGDEGYNWVAPPTMSGLSILTLDQSRAVDIKIKDVISILLSCKNLDLVHREVIPRVLFT